MLSTLRTTASNRVFAQIRTASTQAQKRAGDISDAFASLSGQNFAPLGPEYAELKARLIRGHESKVRESWERLLRVLREEIPSIVQAGSRGIPEIDFKDLDNAPEKFNSELRKQGVAVVRGVIPQDEALQWKEDIREYIRLNPQTKGMILQVAKIILPLLIAPQPSRPKALRSSNCTGLALNCSPVDIQTSFAHTAS